MGGEGVQEGGGGVGGGVGGGQEGGTIPDTNIIKERLLAGSRGGRLGGNGSEIDLMSPSVGQRSRT